MRSIPVYRGLSTEVQVTRALVVYKKSYYELYGYTQRAGRFASLQGHHQAIIEEYYATREPYRGRHLVCGVRAAAISSNKSTGVFDQLLELIDD